MIYPPCQFVRIFCKPYFFFNDSLRPPVSGHQSTEYRSAAARTCSSLPPQWKGQGGGSPGMEEWELHQCKFRGQNKISVGVIFLKCIIRFLSSIQAYPTSLRHSLKVLKSVTGQVRRGCPSGQHKSIEDVEKEMPTKYRYISFKHHKTRDSATNRSPLPPRKKNGK